MLWVKLGYGSTGGEDSGIRQPRGLGAHMHMPALAEGVHPVGQGLALMTHELQVVLTCVASPHMACTVQTRAWQRGGGPAGPVGPIGP